MDRRSQSPKPPVSPVSGVIRAVNNGASEDPSVVNGDPYGEGWLIKVALDDDEPELLDADGYERIIRS